MGAMAFRHASDPIQHATHRYIGSDTVCESTQHNSAEAVRVRRVRDASDTQYRTVGIEHYAENVSIELRVRSSVDCAGGADVRRARRQVGRRNTGSKLWPHWPALRSGWATDEEADGSRLLSGLEALSGEWEWKWEWDWACEVQAEAEAEGLARSMGRFGDTGDRAASQ